MAKQAVAKKEELSPEELEQEQGAELPEREETSLELDFRPFQVVTLKLDP